MEQLRMTIEVVTGKRTCFVCLDFNTGYGKVRTGDKEVPICFIHYRRDLIVFGLDEKDWYTGLFNDDLREVKVAHQDGSHKCNTVAGSFSMRWVGSSANDRREEPSRPEDAQYSAKAHGISVEELLKPI